MQQGIFEYQSMLTSVINGISGALLTSVQSVAYVLMTICLVLGIYEAYVRGGDIRSLAGAFLKYAVAAFVIGYWSNLFSDLFTGFNQIANSIDSSFGAGDLLTSWETQLERLFTQKGYQGMATSIPWTPSAVLTLIEMVLAYFIFPISAQIFALIYTFWGSCLFVMGPLVIALAPSSAVNSLSKYYALNLGIWNAWTLIYAVFGCMITAIHANDVNAIVNGNLGSFGFGGAAFGALDGGVEMIGLISIIYAVCILLIPMVAAFILRGQFSAVGAGLTMALSRMVNGGISGARAGTALGPAGGVAGAAAGMGVGMLGIGTQGLFSSGGGGTGSGGVSFAASGTGSMPPPNTPDDPNLTRQA